MTNSAKALSFILLGGIIWAIFRLFTSQGGGGLEDCIRALVYTSIALFVVSIFILLLNKRKLKDSIDELIFLGISTPVTVIFIIEKILT
jgi:hypothetical protein